MWLVRCFGLVFGGFTVITCCEGFVLFAFNGCYTYCSIGWGWFLFGAWVIMVCLWGLDCLLTLDFSLGICCWVAWGGLVADFLG